MEIGRLISACLAISAFTVLAQPQTNTVPPKKNAQPKLMAPVAPSAQAKTNSPMMSTAPSTLLQTAGNINDVEHMTPVQFHLLPPTAIVRYKNQTISKAGFMQQRLREYQAGATTGQQNWNTNFDTARLQFVQKQAAGLAARNTRVQTLIESFTRRMQQLQASTTYLSITKEADDLQQRYRTASPAEQARIKQRAAELYSQSMKLEQGVTLQSQ